MTTMFSSTSRIALLAAGCLAMAPLPALADSFTIDGTVTTPQTLQGTQTGVIETGGQLNVTGTAITWNGNATGTGVVITNRGTVTATTRGIDSASNVTGNITIDNQLGGLISSTGNDAIRVQSALDANSTVTINNAGTIRSATGQALDLRAVTNGDTIVTNYSTGTIDGQHDDGIRLGADGHLINYGTVTGGSLNTVDIDVNKGDGVDFGDDLGGTVDNYDGGTITGSRHGVTAGQYITVNNYKGGTITGLNGSGVGSDGTGTVTNYGTITGTIDTVSANGDGDGVDIDLIGTVTNYGTIQGLGAKGEKDGQVNESQGVAIGGGTITNAAKDAVIFGKADGILVDDGNDGAAYGATTIANYGSITGESRFGVKLVGDYNDVFYNYGSVVGGNGTAVDMGGGNDRFVYVVGSTVDGYVTGGDGTDELELQGKGSFSASDIGDAAQYRSFELLSVRAGSNFLVTGATTALSNVEIGGTVTLDGDLGDAATLVQNGGILRGTGFTGATTIEAGAVISPGDNSIGRLTLNSVAFQSGSFYDVDIDLLSSDQIATTTAGSTISNGAIVRLASDGGPLQIGKTYTIVDFSGQQQATQFGGVEHDFLFIDPVLGNAPVDNDVTLTLDRNGRRFADVANTRNQAAVANAIENAANTSSLYQHLVSATDEDTVRSNYNSLSGEAHASLGTVLFSQNTLVTDTIASRLRQAPVGTTGALAALGSDGPATAYATKAPAYPAFKAVKAPPPGPVYATWAQGFGQWIDASSDGNAAKVDATVGGFLAGADVTLNNFTFGLAGGYSTADSDVNGRSSSVDADTVLIAAYAGASFDAFKLRAGGSYGWSDIDSHRTAVVGDIVEKPTASYDGNTASLFGEAAYVFQVANVAFEPFAQIAWSQIETDSFTEKNAPITGLTSGGLDFDTTYSTLGARVATTFDMSGAAVTPHASLAWRHAFDGVTPEMAVAFSSTGTAFSVAGTPIAEDSLVVGAGLDVGIGNGLSLNINYEGQFADEAEYNAVKGGFAYRF